MKKQLLALTILLLGYQATSQSAMMLAAASAANKSNKPKIMASEQTKEVKVKKGHKLISSNPDVVSVHKKNNGSTSIIARKAGGKTFLVEIKEDVKGFFNDIGEFFEGTKTGINDNDNKKKKPKKSHKIEVALNKMPTKMKEDTKVYVVRNTDDKFQQINKNDDNAGAINIKHIKIDDDHYVVRLHAKDDGDTPVQLKNKTTDAIHHITIDPKIKNK